MNFTEIAVERAPEQRRNAFRNKLVLAFVVMFGALGSAHAVPTLSFSLEDKTNGGGFFADVLLTDTAPNTVSVFVDIADPVNAGLTQGDILTIFLDVLDPATIAGLDAVDGVVTAGTDSSGNALPNPTSFTPVLTYDLSTLDSNEQITNPQGGIGGMTLSLDMAVSLGDGGNKSTDGFFETLTFDLVADPLINPGFGVGSFSDSTMVGLRVQSIEGNNMLAFSDGSSKLVGGTTGGEVPLPGTLALLGIGLVGFSIARRDRPTDG